MKNLAHRYLLETERLRLRELTPDDASFAFELNADPEVLKYTGDEPFESLEEARIFLENYSSYKRYGFGRWGIELKSNSELIGWCGLKYDPDLDEFDIGFRLFRKFWNQGFASEAALRSLELGFEHFNMPEIVGRAHHENFASQKVLEKIGLSLNAQQNDPNWLIYSLKRVE